MIFPKKLSETTIAGMKVLRIGIARFVAHTGNRPTENLLLEAVSQGLGAVWLGIAPLAERMEAARRVLRLPDDLEAFAFIACGYPAEERPQQSRYAPERIHRVL